MALIDATTWQTLSTNTVTGGDLAAVTGFCAAVSASIARKIYPVVGEPITLTTFAMDAPTGNVLTLPLRPCRTLSALYLAWCANGDPSKATSDTLLTPYTDYYMPIDDAVANLSRAGIVYRRGSSVWGIECRRPAGRLGFAQESAKGALFVTGDFGFTAVPADLQEAAARAVTLLYQRRVTGMPATSESWGGYSISYAGPFTADAAVNSPEVVGLLVAGGYLGYHVG